MARVENSFGPRPFGRIDGVAVPPNRLIAELVHRDDEHLLGAVERGAQAARVGKITLDHTHATLFQIFRVVRVANADPDLIGGKHLEQALDNLPAHLTRGPCDDDHRNTCFR